MGVILSPEKIPTGDCLRGFKNLLMRMNWVTGGLVK